MFLTDEEITELTGLKRARAQLAWLRANGWPVEVDVAGRPKLLRAVVEARMGAVPLHQQAGPNWEALRNASS